jgi:hypothetical protein
MTGTQDEESTVNPAKWLATLREWVPGEQPEVLGALIKSLIEAAGQARVEGLGALITHTNETTRSGREKFERLRQWNDKMRADPLYWPQLFKRSREVSILIKGILDKSSRPLDRYEVERKYSRFRKVPPSGLSQELKEMAKRGEIDRLAAGVYWRKGTAPKRYESQAQQLYRLLHEAPGHRMRNADLAVAINISRQDLETLLSQMRNRWHDPPLIKGARGGVTVVSPKSLAVLKRDGRIVDGRGGAFFTTPKFVERTEAVTFTTSPPVRPPVHLGKLAQELARLKGLKQKQKTIGMEALAKASGVTVVELELIARPATQASKHAQRIAIAEAAKEQWRAEYRILARDRERLPNRNELWQRAQKKYPALTRQLFRDILSEEEPVQSGPRSGIHAERNGANS